MITEKATRKHLYSRPPLDPNVENSLVKIARRIPHGSTVLDVGCAVGMLGQYLTEHQGCSVDGIEGNAEAAEIARPFYRRVAVTDLESAVLRDVWEGVRYDRIVCADVLEHLRDPGQVLCQLSDLLAPSGKLLISIPNIAHVGVFLELLSGDFRYREEGLLDRTHLRFFTRRSFLYFLAENGFAGQIVDRIVVDLQHSEFSAIPLEIISPSLLREMQDWDDNITYQFIVEAYHQEIGESVTPIFPVDKAVSHGPRFACQVFWRSNDELFTEHRSQRIYLPVGVDRQRVDFTLPKGLVQALRFDPSEQKGFLRVYTMRLYDGAECLWTWDGNIETLLRGTLHSIFPAPLKTGEVGVVLSLLDEDPWLELPVPPEILSRAEHLEVELSWPMSADYMAVQEEWEDLLKQNQRLAIELDATQQSSQIRAGELTVALQTAEEQNQRLAIELDAMLRSKSWKLTNPLRITVRSLRAGIQTIRLLLAPGKQGYEYRYAFACTLYRRIPLPGRIKRALRNSAKRLLPEQRRSDYDKWVSQYDTLTDADRADMRSHIASFANPPIFSVVMPTYNTPEKFLRKAIESVRCQIYPYWELCIADDASTLPHVQRVLEEYVHKDSRIKLVFREQNGHISAASNSALELATGGYIALLDHDDELSEHALYMVADCINKYSDGVDIIYSDEDKINQNGQRYDPYFKAQWNRYFIYSQNFVAHLGVYRRAIVEEIGGFRIGYEGSQDYDLLLRMLGKTSDDKIKHIPFVLYHWRNFPENITFSSTLHHISDKSACKALNEHFSRAKEKILLSESRTVKGCWDQEFEMEFEPSVSIIIPTKDNIKILSACIDSLIFNTGYKSRFEVLIVDNNSVNEDTFEYFRKIKNDNLPFDVSIIYDKGEFNYSYLNNTAVREANGDIIVFLNNDVKAISEDWLKRIVSIASRKDVGVVGAKLLYDNNTVQHAGVLLGIYGVAAHPFRGIPADHNVYFGYPNLLREVSAVTAACMGIKKSLFIEAGGFDESLFPISYNDVDLSLKVLALGYKNIFAPMIRLYHFESKSRGTDDSPTKVLKHRLASKNMILKYGSLLRNDPYYSPNLSLENENFEISYPPRVAKPWRNWIEFIVPFHRGDVLLAAQVAEHAHKLGIPLRLHVSSELKNIVSDLNPSYRVETVSCGLPSAEQIATHYDLAKNLVELRPDFSGKVACVHGAVDFKTNGLNIVEKMLHELELPIDGLLNNLRPNPSQLKHSVVNKKTILLHPVGGWGLKSMPQHFVLKLVNYLNDKDYQVIQIGGEKDEVFTACNAAILKNYSLADWAALFDSAIAVLCVDSWMSHFAAIMDVNHVVFYGSTHSFYTNSRRHFVEKTSAFMIVETLVECAPCDSLVCRKYPKNYCHTFDMIKLDTLNEFLVKIAAHGVKDALHNPIC